MGDQVMMPRAGSAAAYLVTTYAMTASGELIEVGNTICRDLTLALEMAESDCAVTAGVTIFALDAEGAVIRSKPIASLGIFQGGRATQLKGVSCETAGILDPGLRLP